jgi:hypothetical protein
MAILGPNGSACPGWTSQDMNEALHRARPFARLPQDRSDPLVSGLTSVPRTSLSCA